MSCKFVEGKKYYSQRDPDRYLTVERVCHQSVVVRGLFTSREKLLTDVNGDEYFEISDPFKGTFRYSAKNIW